LVSIIQIFSQRFDTLSWHPVKDREFSMAAIRLL
jgi:hypothetical protein